MPLGPEDPTWAALRLQLAHLVEATAADNAYVLDAWANTWCSARAVDWAAPGSPATFETMLTERLLVPSLLDSALRSLKKPLQRGGKLDGTFQRLETHAYVRSFASVYVLMVRFDGPFHVAEVRAAVVPRLPDIERLTAALPPPGGPGAGGVEGVGVA